MSWVFEDESSAPAKQRGWQFEEPEKPLIKPAEGFIGGLGYGAKRTAGLVKNALNDATLSAFDNPVGRGIDRVGQAIGLDSMYDVKDRNKQALDANKLEAPRDAAGKVGNVIGSVAAIAPTMMIPGANTYMGAGLIGAGTGAVLSEGDSADQRVRDAAIGATGGVVGRAVVPAATGLYRGTKESLNTLLGAQTREPTMGRAAEALSQKAAGLYDQAEASGVRFKQKGIEQLRNEIFQAVGPPNPLLRPKTSGLMQELEELKKADEISLTALDEFRQIIGKEMKNAQPSDLRTLAIMKDKLDSFGNKVSPDNVSGDYENGIKLLTEARKAWSMKAKAQVLDDIYSKADLNASGQNNNQALGTIINGFKALAKDPKKLRAFSQEEQEIIKSIVLGGPKDRVLRLIGRLSPTGPISGGIGGAAVMGAGPVGLAIPVAGMVAKNAATKSTKQKIGLLEDVVMRGESIPGTRLAAPLQGQQKALTPYQDTLMRLLQTSGIALPNINQQ